MKQLALNFLTVLTLLALTLSPLGVTPVRAAGILHVIPGGTGDCSNWTQACDLQDALTIAASGEEIWVAVGTYKPTAGLDRTATFQLVSGVEIYGGFDGTETLRTERDPAGNITILSGDLLGDDNSNVANTEPTRIDNSYHVVTGATSATLDGFTITAGNANGSIPAAFGGGMYNSYSSPTVTNVTFRANSADYGGGMYNFDSSPTVTNVTFSGNSATTSGGGMFNLVSSPTVTNVTFNANSATTSGGGGMYNNDGSSPTVTNATFSDNSATSNGGGMYNNGGSSPTITDVTFSGNSAAFGGGMYNGGSSPTVTDVIFSGNSATSSGGGMHNGGSSPSSPTVTDVIFSGNSADWGGGMSNYSSSPTVTNVSFSNNSATSSGGGMLNSNSNPTVTNVTFINNLAFIDGGGMANFDSSPTITNVTFSGNSATDFGGGMLNSNSSPTATDVTFSGNSAEEGGGMFNFNSSNPTVTNVTFSGNSAPYGGGISNFDSSPTFTNTTFSGNSATYSGGGMLNSNSNPTVTNVTFNANSADEGGGMFNESDSSPQIHNSIFWGNIAPGGAQIYNSSGTPVISDSIIQNGYAGGTNIITADPLLGVLGDYGGFTETIPLLPGSSAIDVGNATHCPTGIDQREFNYIGTCDIGAFESRGFTLTKNGGDGQWAVINTNFANPLALTVTSAFSEPVDGGQVIFMAPTSGASINPDMYTTTITGGGISQTVTANGIIGPYNVTASTAGASSVNFSLTNVSGCAPAITVTNIADSGAGSLRQAIADVCPSGTITFEIDLSGQTITLASTLTLDKNMLIDGSALPTQITISGNNADRVFTVNGGIAILESLTISHGTAFNGGGIYNGGTLTVNNSTVSGNSASNYGGGIYNEYGTLTVNNSTISGNFATNFGGGIGDYMATTTVSNSTVSGNTTSHYGGGMYTSGSSFSVTNSTLWGNSAVSGGGFYNAIGSGTTLQNTIVANSPAGGDCLIDSSTLTADVFNLDSDGSCGNATQKTVLEINLGVLEDNGGRTLTHELLPGSAAIDAADDAVCMAAPVNNLDQRSFGRPQGTHCDIGAFEAEAALPVLLVTNTNESGAHSLAKAVDEANAGAGGTIELASNLSGETISLTESLILEQDVTLNASALTEPLTISGGNNTPVMVVRPGATVMLEGLQIEGSIIIERIDSAAMSFKVREDDDEHGKLKVKDGIFKGAGGTIETLLPMAEAGAGAKLELTDPSFTGGIYNAGELEITDSTFEGFVNTANGGGLYNSGSMSVLNSTFKGNQSDLAGGAIYNTATLTVINSTFSGNLAAQGGGIYNAGTLSIFNSTFSNSGVYNEAKGILNYVNTILANTATGTDCVNHGALGFDINNLIEDGSCSASLSGDPLLAPLADNGGPTLTLALLPGSPAIDAGSDAACAAIEVNNLDQRGETRLNGLHCDIGAFEYNPAPRVISVTRAGPNATTAATLDFTVTFSETVTGVDVGDFSLTTSAGVSSAAVSGISGSGSIYVVTVNTGSGNGIIRLNVMSDGTIIDSGNNHLAEAFTSGESYTVIKTATFFDVPLIYWASSYIERLYAAGITGGCGVSPTSPLIYCPDKYITRAEMAVFLLKGTHGPSFSPPPATGLVFDDVPASHWAAAWIEQLAAEGITAGCGNGNYCPNQTATTRSQMAVFLLRAKYGSKYVPPAPSGIFNDVPTDHWAAAWIEQLAAEGITGGCGNGNYCPEGPLTRAQMAVFLVRAFNLP